MWRTLATTRRRILLRKRLPRHLRLLLLSLLRRPPPAPPPATAAGDHCLLDRRRPPEGAAGAEESVCEAGGRRLQDNARRRNGRSPSTFLEIQSSSTMSTSCTASLRSRRSPGLRCAFCYVVWCLREGEILFCRCCLVSIVRSSLSLVSCHS